VEGKRAPALFRSKAMGACHSFPSRRCRERAGEKASGVTSRKERAQATLKESHDSFEPGSNGDGEGKRIGRFEGRCTRPVIKRPRREKSRGTKKKERLATPLARQARQPMVVKRKGKLVSGGNCRLQHPGDEQGTIFAPGLKGVRGRLLRRGTRFGLEKAEHDPYSDQKREKS